MIKRFKKERGSTKWLWLVLVVIGCVLTIPAIASRNNGASAQTASSALTSSPTHAPTAQEIKARSQYWFSKQGFAHGISSGAFTDAIAQVNQEESSGSTRRLAGPDITAGSWDFLGPDPISLLTLFAPGVSFGSPHTGAGAFTAVAVDSQSGDIFAGSANGGLYLSADGGSTFSQIFNGEPSEAIGAIAIDTTTSPSTVYVGTGNPNGNLDDYYGAGVFKSTDLGNTWTQIMPASFANGAVAVSKIALDPANHIIFVGATWGSSASRADASIIESDFSQAGLWESSDGGSTWTQYAPTALGNCYFVSTNYPCPVDDVEIDPAVNASSSHNVYVAVDGLEGNATNTGGVFRSTNEGGTFGSAPFIASGSRSSIAIGQPTGSNGPAGVAYFMIGDTEGEAFVNFWYSADGTTLKPETVPSFSSGGFTFDGINPNNQVNSFYSQTLTVLPGTSNTVFFGGVGIYRGVNTGSNMNWQSIVNTTQGGAAANQHAFAYDAATSQMLLADDGGMYSFNPASTSNVTFTSLNTTIDTTLVQSVGPNPTNNSLLVAGFQGAGTQQYQAGTWAFPTSEAGDGGFAMYDPTDPNYAYHTSSNDNWGIASNFSDIYFAFSKNANSTTSAATWSSATPSKNLIAAMKLAGDEGAAFYPPITVDPTTSHRVFFGGHAVYVSNDGGTTWVLQANYDLTDGGCIDGTCALQDIEPVSHTNGWALSMADPLQLNDTFVLSNTTTLNLDTTNNGAGGTWSTSPTTTLAPLVPQYSTQATGIAVDHNNPNTAYLSLSGFYGGAAGTGVGHIYVTKDFGNTWAEADGGTAQSNPPSTALPDVPVLRVLVDSADTTGNTLYAATDIGVFQSTNGGTDWASFNLGTLQAIPVFDIEENQNNSIFIGTHGKGVYQLIASTPAPTPTPTSSATPTPTATATTGSTPTPTPTPVSVPGSLTVSPASITFPATAFGASGATSKQETIKVSNPKKSKTPSSITITGVDTAGDSNGTYTVVNNGCAGKVLSPNGSCTIIVVYTPLAATKSSGSLTVDNNSTGTPTKSVTLKGTGVLGSLTAAPKALKFPATAIGTPSSPLTVNLDNKTAAPIGVSGVELGGKTGTTDYAITTDTCSGTTVAKDGGSCTETLTFTPTAKGSRAATLTVVATTKAPLNIPLSGTGK